MARETLGRWLRQAMDGVKPGMSYRELEEYSGVPRSVISSILTNPNHRPKPINLRRLATYFKVEFDFLWNLAWGTPPDDINLRGLVIMVPVVWGRAAAGSGGYAEAEYWPYTPREGEEEHRYIGIVASGDCLDPRIRTGEQLIVDKDASPRNNEVVVIEQDGEMLLKVWERRNGAVWLTAFRHHEPLLVDENTTFVGVVRKAVRDP